MRPYLWLLVISLVSVPVTAETGKTTADQRVGEGLMLVLKGEKEKAWNLLFPEAKAGNVIAMFQLGMLMVRSPEYDGNLEKARKFFSAAAERGHKGSAAMLAQVDGLISKQGATPQIAGASGVPVPKDIESAKLAFTKAQERVGRFVGDLQTTTPKATVKAFITDDASSLKDLIDIASKVQATFGDKVEFQYYVLISQAGWNPRKVFTSASKSLPVTGFRPDLNGAEAAKYGVRTTPAIVLVPEKGQPKILSGVQSVISELSSVIR